MEEKIKTANLIIENAENQYSYSLIIRKSVTVFVILSIFFIPILGVFLMTFSIGPGLFRETPPYIGWIILVMIYLSLFVLPFLFSLPLIIPFAKKSKSIHRIVVFRKFHTISNKTLKKTLRSSIGNFGHVFTLSDTHFKEKWYVRIPIIYGHLSFFHFRNRTIRKSKHLDKLSRKLKNRSWLTVNWLLSKSKVFAIKTNDEFWKDTAQLLVKDTSIIVIEISEVTESLVWEMEMISKQGLANRTILMANEKYKDIALDWKKQFDATNQNDTPLLLFSKQHHPNVKRTIANVLTNIPIYQEKVSTKKIWKKTLSVSTVITSVTLVVLFFISPYVFPSYVARNSRIPYRAVNAHLQSHMNSNVRDLSIAGNRDVIRERFPIKASEVAIAIATDHHRAECGAVLKTLEDFANKSQLPAYINLVKNAEPDVSNKAFELIGKWLNKEDSIRIGLQFIDNERVSVKNMGLSLIEDNLLNISDLQQIVNMLMGDDFSLGSPIFQHKAQNSLDFGSLFSDPDKSPERQKKKFLLNLSHLLIKYSGNLESSELKLLYDKADYFEIQMVLALVLVNKCDNYGLKTLVSREYIQKYYEQSFSRDRIGETIMLFGHKPFKELTNSVFSKFLITCNLETPLRSNAIINQELHFLIDDSIDDNALRTMEEIELPFSLATVAMSKNILADVQEMGFVIDTMKVAEQLYEKLKDGIPMDRKKRIVSANQHYLLPLLKRDEMGEKVKIAWLLAHVGAEEARTVGRQASRYKKETWLFENVYIYPYSGIAEEIREIMKQTGLDH